MALRSTFAGLNTMYRGISTNRVALETTGHNMTNSSVEGYSRQSVNQAATQADAIYASGMRQYIGSGVDSLSITRARDVYADKQYWREYGDMEYYNTRQTNYQKLEAIFNDSNDNGLEDAITKFYKQWSDLSTTASDTSARTAVLEEGRILADRLLTSSKQLQEQIKSEYEDIKINVAKVNTITDQIVQLNKAIMAAESAGGSANDLRDERDNLADQLSGFMSISVSENSDSSMYTIVSNGTSIVNGITKFDLTVGPQYKDGSMPGIPNPDYGVTDYNIEIGNTGVIFDPLTGTLAAEIDAIQEDKDYIDKVADMSAFLLTTFNVQHKVGAGMDVYVPDPATGAFPSTGLNFYGEDGVVYLWDDTNKCVKIYDQTVSVSYDSGTEKWVLDVSTAATESRTLKAYNIIEALHVNTTLTATDGERKIAARAMELNRPGCAHTWEEIYTTPGLSIGHPLEDVNGTADGSNAVLMSTLLNEENPARAGLASIGVSSLQGYYQKTMTGLGVDSSSIKNKVIAQEDIMDQVMQWRTSIAGVNWDEELTNMIMFQQGYSACSRCLTTMDEMLDRLINSTGLVGR